MLTGYAGRRTQASSRVMDKSLTEAACQSNKPKQANPAQLLPPLGHCTLVQFAVHWYNAICKPALPIVHPSLPSVWLSEKPSAKRLRCSCRSHRDEIDSNSRAG
eukprot:1156931-Pelagomonas_calceolata.AAC.15